MESDPKCSLLDENIVEPQDMVTMKSASHTDNLVAAQMKFKSDGDLCDVTIKCGDMEIQAHRLVLASATDYFKAMFVNETKESETGIVEFPEMPSDVVKQCIEFIYSGVVKVSMNTIKDVIDASEMMQLPALSKVCVKFLAERVNMESCAEVITLSNLYCKGALNSPIEIFLSNHFAEFIETEDFMTLDLDTLIYCLELLRDGGREREALIWNGILAWVRHDKNHRKNLFTKLFELVNLSLFSKPFVKDKVLSESLVKDSNECLMIVAQNLTEDSARPTKKEIKRIYCYDESSQMMLQYEPETGLCSSFTTFPSKFSNDTHVIWYRGCVYVSDGVSLYQLCDGKWSRTRTVVEKSETFTKYHKCADCYTSNYVTFTRPAMPSPTYSRCIGVGNCVYMITSNYICEFDINTSILTRHNEEVGLSSGFCLAASQEKIYIMGNQRQLAEFDVNTKKCGFLSDMLNAWSFGLAFWYNGKIFTFCSSSKTDPSTVECYHAGVDRWVAVPDLVVPHQPINLFFGAKLYLIGANSDNEPTFHAIDLQNLKLPYPKMEKKYFVPVAM